MNLKKMAGLRFGNMSLKNKILLPVISIVVVFTSIFGLALNKRVAGVVIHNTLKQSQQTVKQTCDYLQFRLKTTQLQFNYLEINRRLLGISEKENPSIEDRQYIAQLFEETRSQNQELVDSIFLCGKHHDMYYEYIKVIDPQIKLENQDWYDIAERNRGRTVWQGFVNDEIFLNNSGIKKFRIIKTIRNRFEEPVGKLVFELKEPAIRQLIREVEVGSPDRVYLLDSAGEVVTMTGEPDESDRKLLDALLPETAGTIVTDKLVTSFNTLDINDWKLVYIMSKESLTSQTRGIRLFTVYSILLGLVLMLVFARLFVNWLTRPVNKLVALLKKFESGDFTVRFNAQYHDEIGNLGAAFDGMCGNITELFDRLAKEEALKQYAELKVLQEQIKSHFLYNTLDSIYWMARSGDNHKTANMIACLAKIFRLALNNGKDITTVAREIEHLESYIYIEKIRKGESYQFSIETDPGIADYHIPKIILQPLVENAIVHGIYDNKKGVITVRGYETQEHLVFEVCDNGGKIQVEKLEALLEEACPQTSADKGYALINLKNRLEMIYRREGLLKFECVGGEMTKVSIIVPKEIP